MEIGISTASFYPMQTEDTIKIISDMESSLCEVFLEAEYEYGKEFIRELKNEWKAAASGQIRFMHFVRLLNTSFFRNTSAEEGMLLFYTKRFWKRHRYWVLNIIPSMATTTAPVLRI